MRFVKFALLFFLILFVLSVSLVTSYYYLVPKIETPVSILILGKGGEGHTAPNLTDTIMLTNLNVNSRKTTIISLPRDMWISEIRAKLNTAYHYGGFKMATDSISSITGLPINYVLVVDFSLFKDLIDTIGGINVEIENFFVDEKYPIAGLENDFPNENKKLFHKILVILNETLRFAQGKQNMDGETALKFVRSRNAIGDEGTDIAREKRQQKIIAAIKEKLLSKEVLLNPTRINNLYKVFISHIETDIDKKTLLTLSRFAIESKFNVNFLNSC